MLAPATTYTGHHVTTMPSFCFNARLRTSSFHSIVKWYDESTMLLTVLNFVITVWKKVTGSVVTMYLCTPVQAGFWLCICSGCSEYIVHQQCSRNGQTESEGPISFIGALALRSACTSCTVRRWTSNTPIETILARKTKSIGR